MRYGCCSNLLSGGPAGASGTGAEYLERIAAAGFDYVEMPLGVITRLEAAAFSELTGRIDRSGIRCEVCTNLFPPDLSLTGPQTDAAAIGRQVAAALSRAQRLGAAVIVFGSGRARSVPEGFPREAAREQLLELLRRIAPEAESAGLCVVIEPLRRAESNLINTYEEACQLAAAIGRPGIQALVDYYHLATEREPAAHLVSGAAWLRHVHYASLAGRRFPPRPGDEESRAFFAALKTAGYDSRISLEAYTDDFDREAAPALRFLKQQTMVRPP